MGNEGAVPTRSVDRAMELSIAFQLRDWLFGWLLTCQLRYFNELGFGSLGCCKTCGKGIELYPDLVEFIEFATRKGRYHYRSVRLQPNQTYHLQTSERLTQWRDRDPKRSGKRLLVHIEAWR